MYLITLTSLITRHQHLHQAARLRLWQSHNLQRIPRHHTHKEHDTRRPVPLHGRASISAAIEPKNGWDIKGLLTPRGCAPSTEMEPKRWAEGRAGGARL